MTRFILAASLFAASLYAEGGITLRGVVKDPQSKSVDGAQIRLFRLETGASVQTSSDREGRYVFERLAAGSFLLQVDKESFQSQTRNVELKEGGAVSADIVLSVAGVNDSVVVTAAGAPQKLDEISKAVSLVSAEEIRNRDEYSLSDTLRAVPGVVVTNGGGPGQNTSIRIRGLRTDAAAVLVDGLRFRDATTTQGDSSSFMSTFNIVSPDHIEVLRGSASSLYGSNAVAGVVNIVTQEGGGPLHGDLQAEGGSLGMLRTRGTLSGGAFGDRLKFSAGLLHLNIRAGSGWPRCQSQHRRTGLRTLRCAPHAKRFRPPLGFRRFRPNQYQPHHHGHSGGYLPGYGRDRSGAALSGKCRDSELPRYAGLLGRHVHSRAGRSR